MKTLSAHRRASCTTVSRRSCDAVMSRKTSSSAPSTSYRSASSTGSPASRMSTKFVPFTTRPLSTSRHGMTRLSSIEQLLHLRDREAALVQGLARHDAGEVEESKRAEPAEVVERPDPAGVEEAPAGELPDALDLVEVRPLEHPVAVHVGVDEGTHAAS